MKRSKALAAAAAVLTLLLCAALCAGVLSLYLDGVNRRAQAQSATEPLFTREAAGRCLMWISPLFALWLAAVIAAWAAGAPAQSVRPGRFPGGKAPAMGQPETPARRLARAALCLLAAALIVLGVINGGLSDVLVKAIHICTECIGLG